MQNIFSVAELQSLMVKKKQKKQLSFSIAELIEQLKKERMHRL